MTTAQLTVGEATAPRRSMLVERFQTVRGQTLKLAEPLSPEDQVIQSMDDASPTKWHLAHVTWFFETFILKPEDPAYEEFHPDFSFLFNSYYIQVGPRHERPKRGMLSRPALSDVEAYRAHVDAAMVQLMEKASDTLWEKLRSLVILGLHHEQQHQELLLTDIKHALSQNPLKPAYVPAKPRSAIHAPPLDWIGHPGGLLEIGHEGDGFAYDNEGPQHKVWLEPFEIANRPVTCGDYLAFIEDGGYQRPEFWLSDGWIACQERGWQAPDYWQQDDDGNWSLFTLSGMKPLMMQEPVSHVSFFEADAYARWADARLPTEAEWEVIARDQLGEQDHDRGLGGNVADSGYFHPRAAAGEGCLQMFGDVWEWTQSPYTPYRGFKPAAGAIGEYNGKFMSGQMVLRGGSCATPAGHIRVTYRNFFYPPDRWQFSGIRLARDT